MIKSLVPKLSYVKSVQFKKRDLDNKSEYTGMGEQNNKVNRGQGMPFNESIDNFSECAEKVLGDGSFFKRDSVLLEDQS